MYGMSIFKWKKYFFYFFVFSFIYIIKGFIRPNKAPPVIDPITPPVTDPVKHPLNIPSRHPVNNLFSNGRLRSLRIF